MRTQTEVILNIHSLEASENLYLDPIGFFIKVFLACTRADTKFFRARSAHIPINQTLTVRNIAPKEIQFWLCNKENKILAVGTLPVMQQGGEHCVELQMTKTEQAKLSLSMEVRTTQIEKEEIIQPDEQLLKKEQDPLLKKKKEEEEIRLAKQANEAAEAAKFAKKPAVTLTHFHSKDQPFV